MIECHGVCYCNTAEAVTGRLCGTDKARLTACDTAQILLWNGKEELSDTLLSSAVGVVFPNDIPPSAIDKASRLAKLCQLPALGVSFPDRVPQNGIAILDTSLSRLYVDPDLDTINAYFGARKRERKAQRLLLEANTVVSLADTRYCGLIAKLQNDADEQRHYDFLCELADTNTGAELVAYAGANDTDSFIGEVRAIYRAGVWGRFSLLLAAVRTPDELDNRACLMHKAFSMLQAEGREFNGFIPKGLLIDTPLLMLSKPRGDLLDFFCFDFERLRHLLTSSPDTRVGERDTVHYIEEFARSTKDARISLRGTEHVSVEALNSLTQGISPYSIYEKK